MKILFIRHAEAIEGEEWAGDDMSRPLTRMGKRTAAAMAEFLRRTKNIPEHIVSSEAVRAKETAAFFARRASFSISDDLNPGCTTKKLLGLLRRTPKERSIAVVGHEPDFSLIIAKLIGDGSAQIKMAKGACAIIELGPAGGRLLTLVAPSMLGGKVPTIEKKRPRKFQSLEKGGGHRRDVA